MSGGLVVLLLAAVGCAGVHGQAGNDAGQSGSGGSGGGPGPSSGSGGSGGGGGTGGSGGTYMRKPRGPLGPWGGTIVDPGAPANAPTLFGGADTAAGGPTIVYPLDDSMHPVNIADIAIQWQAPGAAAVDGVYRMRFQNARGTMDVFVACKVAECTYQAPIATWLTIADANPDADVAMTISLAGAQVRSSAPIKIHFSPDDVAGGLYYWSTGDRKIYRLAFGQQKAQPYNPAAGQGEEPYCVGCHSVSRNGRRIALVDMSADSFTTSDHAWYTSPTDVSGQAKRTVGPLSPPAVSPDGSKILIPTPFDLRLYDAVTSALIGKVNPTFVQGKLALFPEWSPDSKEIAITISRDGNLRPQPPPPQPGEVRPTYQFKLGGQDSEIAVLPYNDGNFGPARTVVPAGADFNYYPSWSPDGKWIVFSSAPVVTSGTLYGTYDNPNARLRLVSAAGGKVYELGRATQGTGKGTSWPKVAPFSQAGGQVMFVGYNATIDYGFVHQGGHLAANKGRPGPNPRVTQLWFAAIDLRRLGEGDPSWAPIWLPFQYPQTSNHIPYWTELLGCTKDIECGPRGTCITVPGADRRECLVLPVVP